MRFENTYYLAYRDIPEIIKTYVKGTKALDFGCGTGRSSRFLEQLQLETIGVDISNEMISIAKNTNPKGDYRCITDGKLDQFSKESFDLILSAFTFDNIQTIEKKTTLFKNLSNILKSDGIFINLVSSPDIYTHEWASFSTKDFPENKDAKTGDVVPIITTDIEDKRPCYDIYCTHEDYAFIYNVSGFNIVKKFKPLATGKEPYNWVNETKIAPWIIYLLKTQT